MVYKKQRIPQKKIKNSKIILRNDSREFTDVIDRMSSEDYGGLLNYFKYSCIRLKCKNIIIPKPILKTRKIDR